MGVIDCQFLIYEFNYMGNFSLEEIPSDGLENVYGQPQTIEQRIPWLGIQIHSSSVAFVRQKLHQLLDFLEEKKLNRKVIYYKERPLIFHTTVRFFSTKNTERDTGH